MLIPKFLNPINFEKSWISADFQKQIRFYSLKHLEAIDLNLKFGIVRTAQS